MPRFIAALRPARLATAIVAAALLATALNVCFGLGGVAMSHLLLPLLGETILASAAALIAVHAARARSSRIAWTLIAFGVAAWLLGDVYRLLEFPPDAPRRFPSLADAGYGLFYPCSSAALWLLLRERAVRFPVSLWLDSVIGAAGVTSVGASAIASVLMHAPGSQRAALATNLAYPVADLLLLAQIVGAYALMGWRPGRTWTLLGAGLLSITMADCGFAYTTAKGQTYFVAAGAGWILGFVLIGLASRRAADTGIPVRLEGWRSLVVPLVFAIVPTALLAYGNTYPLPALGEWLAVVTMALVVTRTALTFRENLALVAARREALTDDLTGLGNRRRLSRRLEELTTAGSGLAGLLLIDLDGFKELNDTLGHHAGDALLSALGARLARLEGTDLVARLGGDEFAVIVAAGADLAEVAADIRRALDAPFGFDGLSLHVRASVGGARFPEHGEDPAELLRHADVAMYSAKESRSEYEAYRPERDLNSRDRLRFVSELRDALDSDQIVVFYQPKGALADGVLTGVEALVRWQHPEQGLLGPDRFIAIAERAGLMRKLTLRVLDRALAQLRAWNDSGLPVTMAVNLAMPNLLDAALPADVERLLNAHGVHPNRLVLEITENIIMADPDRVLAVVGALHALGVAISLDDFGAGHSSLGYLRRLNVGELKIDRAFVMTMDRDEDNAAIVRAVIELAHNLGLRVVAEGVETSTSLDTLRALGCDVVQGFLLGRPVPAEELADRLGTETLIEQAPALVP